MALFNLRGKFPLVFHTNDTLIVNRKHLREKSLSELSRDSLLCKGDKTRCG